MKKKATTKAAPKHTDEDLKRYLGSLAEHFDDRFDLVIEQFKGMNTRMDGMGSRMDDMGSKLDSHTEMIARMMIQLQEIQSDMKLKVDLQQFARLEKRVVLLEARSRRS